MCNRPLCATERYYLAYGDLYPDFTIQIFFDGSGSLDLPLWQKAVETASRANPGSRLVLRGLWTFSRWVDSGITPRIRVVDGGTWDGAGPEGAPAVIQEPLPPRTGPTSEVILIRGRHPRVGFRAHHAVMDGRGVFTWAEDVFRALRGEAPLGSASRLSDFQAARTFQRRWRTVLPHEFCAPTGMPRGWEHGTIWRHMRIPGRFKEILPQVAVLLSQAAHASGGGKVRFAVPVDLRPRIQGLRSTGNLTNFIYLDMGPATQVNDVSQSVARQLEDRTDGLQYPGDQLVSCIPLMALKRAIRDDIARKQASGNYRNSGVISYLGYVPTKNFQGGGFKTEYVWGIPPGQQSVPIFAGMISSDHDLALIISLPRSLAGQGRIESLMDRLRKGLVPVKRARARTEVFEGIELQ
jgi:hypothetical protein